MLETLAAGFLTFVGITGAANPFILLYRRRQYSNLIAEQLQNVEFAPLREALSSGYGNPVPVGRIVISFGVAIAYLASLWTVLNG